MNNYYGVNRYICTVFSEMRALDKTKNYAPLLGLIEEAQSLANRMESALQDLKDFEAMKKEKSELKKEILQLRKDLGELK